MSRPSAYNLLDPGDDTPWESQSRRSALYGWTASLRRAAPTGLYALAVLIATAVAYDAVTIGSIHRLQASTQATALAAKRSRSELSSTTSKIASSTAARDTRGAATSRALAQIASINKGLTTASHANNLQTLDIASLHACLTGVSAAVAAIGSADLQGAVNSITGASSACMALNSSSGGLAYPFNFPDPFVLTVGSEYYAFATNSAAGNIQVIQSSDLTHWTTEGDALPHLAPWAQSGATWGPSVMQRGSSFVLYYSALDGTTGDQCISEAVATQPRGPYVDSSTGPLVCQLDQGGSIDPSPYVGADGNPYLTWTSQGGNGQPPTLWSQQLSPDGTALVAAPAPLLTPSQGWQAGVVEGPGMLVSGGQYLLFYAGNNWKTASYAIGVADCSGPLGPCTDSSTQPLLASSSDMSGPGGPSLFTDTQGNLCLAFAAWLPGEVGPPDSRPLFVRRVTVTGGVPQVGD